MNMKIKSECTMLGGSSLSSELTQAFKMYIFYQLNKNTCLFNHGIDMFRGNSDKTWQELVFFHPKSKRKCICIALKNKLFLRAVNICALCKYVYDNVENIHYLNIYCIFIQIIYITQALVYSAAVPAWTSLK